MSRARPILSFFSWAAALIIGLVLLFIVLLVQDAKASPQCGSGEQLLTMLSDQYGEERIGEGVTGGARLLIFAHPGGDSWSVVVLLPDGQACLMASGTDWTSFEPTPPGSET